MSKKENARGTTTTSYVAFLRGINNIGSKMVKMDKLKRIFEATGYQNVKTILASGNIVCETTMPGTFALITKTYLHHQCAQSTHP